MAAFERPIDPAAVSRQGEVVVALPDPPRGVNDPITRPGVARYAGAAVRLLRLEGAAVPVKAPVTGTVRRVPKLSPALDGGVTELLEISPLPFGIRKVLRHFRQGLPTFYLGLAPAPAINDDQVVRAGDSLAGAVDRIYFGVLFADRVTLAAAAWVELIRAALDAAGDAAGALAWGALAPIAAPVPAPGRRVYLLDHVGRPLTAAGSFQFRTSPTAAWQDAAASQGALDLPAEAADLRWGGDEPPGDTPLPIHADYMTAASSHPGEPIELTPGAAVAHLQVLDLARWYAPPPPTSTLARYRADSRVEPLVDGVATFRRLTGDLIAAAAPGCGAHLAGFQFTDFPLDEGRAGVNDTSLLALVRGIKEKGGGVRTLVFRLVTLKPGADARGEGAALFALATATNVLVAYSLLKSGADARGGVVLALAGYMVTQSLVQARVLSLSDAVEKLELSVDIMPELNGIEAGSAIWARNPVRLAENPIAELPLPLNLDRLMDQFGSMHQKIQIVKLPRGEEGEFVAYLGGIDLHSDRLDTPGHHGAAYRDPKDPPGAPEVLPFHDVHARLTGPIVADLCKTFDERYAYDVAEAQTRGELDAPLAPAFPPPDANDTAALPRRQARHVAQLARTYFKPRAGFASPLFPFAAEGERTINESLIRCVKAAREYIYIEDQYFTPNDWPARPAADPPPADTLLDALCDAADACQRLLIVVPNANDQPLGDLRRRTVFKKLRDRWEDRLLVGALLRRPVLPDPGLRASEGRCELLQSVAPNADRLVIGPKARLEAATYPFWLWVDGELMLVKGGPRDTPADANGQEVDVIRAYPKLGASTRPHHKGAPVTLAQLAGIYVHSKTMIVDDVMLSTGSSNFNRRGLLHDAEVRVFAIPEQLKAAPDNPARALRTELWAEHLGLPPSLGPTLLADPIAAFDLFRRPMFQGNRFVRYDALEVKFDLNLPVGASILTPILIAGGIVADATGLLPGALEQFWNTLSDPTTELDPHPTPGPL